MAASVSWGRCRGCWCGTGKARSGGGGRAQPELTAECQAFRGTLAAKVMICKPADPEAKGLVERASMTTWSARSCPGRAFSAPADFNAQLQRVAGAGEHPAAAGAGVRPADRIERRQGGDARRCRRWRRAPGGGVARLPRDHYMRLDSNDYSVHPAVIGRRIEVTADLARVRVSCDGQGGRRPRAGLGLAPDASPTPRTWPRRRRCAAAPSPSLRRPARGRGRSAGPGRLRPALRRCDGRGGVMAAKTTARDVTAEMAFLTRALKAPTLREAVRPAGRAGPRRDLDP